MISREEALKYGSTTMTEEPKHTDASSEDGPLETPLGKSFEEEDLMILRLKVKKGSLEGGMTEAAFHEPGDITDTSPLAQSITAEDRSVLDIVNPNEHIFTAGHSVDSLLGDSAAHYDDARVDKMIETVVENLKHRIIIKEFERTKEVVQMLKEELEKNEEDAFYLVDLATVVRKYEQWVTLLPRVVPHYAIKCNPNPILVKTLQMCGAKFDCASKGEIEVCLEEGAKASDIIYANPCKDKINILFAKEKGIKRMTFDNAAELIKIHEVYPEADVVLRIKPPISHAVMDFSAKFGASIAVGKKLIRKCKELQLNLIGVSFHVGSGCYDVNSYVAAINDARKLFDYAEQFGFKMTLLDIGGGYPGCDDPGMGIEGHQIFFKDIADSIRPVMDELFPEPCELVSEPGRYFVTESTVLCVNVIARRENYASDEEEDEEEEDDDDEENPNKEKEVQSFLYYLSDGVYGSFNAILFDHMHPKPQQLVPSNGRREKSYKSTLFGPTCDSMDVIIRDIDLPELRVGDWLYFYNMGAYTNASGSNFNGIALPTCRYVVTWKPVENAEMESGGGEATSPPKNT